MLRRTPLSRRITTTSLVVSELLAEGSRGHSVTVAATLHRTPDETSFRIPLEFTRDGCIYVKRLPYFLLHGPEALGGLFPGGTVPRQEVKVDNICGFVPGSMPTIRLQRRLAAYTNSIMTIQFSFHSSILRRQHKDAKGAEAEYEEEEGEGGGGAGEEVDEAAIDAAVAQVQAASKARHSSSSGGGGASRGGAASRVTQRELAEIPLSKAQVDALVQVVNQKLHNPSNSHKRKTNIDLIVERVAAASAAPDAYFDQDDGPAPTAYAAAPRKTKPAKKYDKKRTAGSGSRSHIHGLLSEEELDAIAAGTSPREIERLKSAGKRLAAPRPVVSSGASKAKSKSKKALKKKTSEADINALVQQFLKEKLQPPRNRYIIKEPTATAAAAPALVGGDDGDDDWIASTVSKRKASKDRSILI